MKSTKHIYGLDLETDTLRAESRAWVVQWALVHSSGIEKHGTDLNSLGHALMDIWQAGKDVFVYSHNMTYDANFYKYLLPRLAANLNAEIQVIKPSTKIITIKLQSKENGGCLHFRDSMAKMPGDLRSLGRIIGLEKLEGFQWFEGWSETVDFDDPANWAYVIRDAEICARSMFKLHKSGATAATSSGDAWKLYKRSFGIPAKWDKHFPRFSYNFDLELRLAYEGGKNFSFHKGDNAPRKGWKIVHDDVNSMYPWAMVENPMPYDKPTVSFNIPSDRSLYIVEFMGKMTLKEGKTPVYMFKQKIDCIAEGIKFGAPLDYCTCEHRFVMTSVDFDTYSDYYDIEINFDHERIPPKFYVFKTKKGMFSDFIDQQMKIKKTAPKGSLEREKAKLNMNGLYGRFALNPELTETVLDWNQRSLDTTEAAILKWKSTTTTNDDNDAYLPVSIFVTAFARQKLIRSAEAVGWENVIHADTDSLIYWVKEDAPEPLQHDNAALGYWKRESEPVRVYEGGVKRYVEIYREPIETIDDLGMACAGVPQRSDHNGVPIGMWVEILDDPPKIASEETLGKPDYTIRSKWLRDLYLKYGMDPNSVNTFKLIPVLCEGGIILEERRHEMNDTMALHFRYRGRSK